MNAYELAQKPKRVCRTMHECCLCGETIHNRHEYFDGGYGRRAHVECVRKRILEAEGLRP